MLLWLLCRKRVQLEHGKEKYGDTVLRQNIRKEEKQMKIGNKEFDLKNHAYVMGILNVTPDSFSDGGKWNDKGRAMRHTQEMIEQGATIIDIGGESTRPGYTLISDEEEISRVVPMIEMEKWKPFASFPIKNTLIRFLMISPNARVTIAR